MPRLKGNGAGWGGPARGEGNRKAGPGRAKGVTLDQCKPALARAALEGAAALAVQTVIDIAGNTDDPRALAAAISIMDRTGLHAKSGVELAGAGGGPVQLTWGDGSE